jgi:hypothetical protein
MVTNPADQLVSTDPASCEIQDEALLVIDGGIDLSAVEDQKGFHRGMSDALVAIDEGMTLNQGEAQRRSLFSQRRVQVDATECGLWLGDGGLERAEISDAGRATRRLEELAVQVDDLPQGEVALQERRRYNSSFFRSTRSAAALKSASLVASRSAMAAVARSSGVRPRRSASWRSRFA